MVLEAAKNKGSNDRKLEEASPNNGLLHRRDSHAVAPVAPAAAGRGRAGGSAVDWYVTGFAARSGIKAKLEIAEPLGVLGKEIELVVFRVLQESLTNVHRHSGSRERLRFGSASMLNRLSRWRSKIRVEACPMARCERALASPACANGSRTSMATCKSLRIKPARTRAPLFCLWFPPPALPDQARNRRPQPTRSSLDQGSLPRPPLVPPKCWLNHGDATL